MDNNKILIVDDDSDILEALKLMLQMEGYQVDMTTKGEEVFKKIEKFNPNLMILDVLLSGKDGREIAKELRNREKTKHLPIIMFSAHPSASRTVKECGADDFLTKPFEIEDLLDKVKKYIYKKKYVD